MIGILGSISTRVVAKIPKQCYPVEKLSQDVEGAIAKLGANVTTTKSFSELHLSGPIGIDHEGVGHGTDHEGAKRGMRCGAGELVQCGREVDC